MFYNVLNTKKLYVGWFIVCFLLPTVVVAANFVWPDLPKKFIKGRPATEADVASGHAAFAMKSEGKIIGKPINIVIPQYAYHNNEKNGKKTPVIIIQAEEGSGIRAVGYQVIGSKSYAVALLREMQLLGKKKPK